MQNNNGPGLSLKTYNLEVAVFINNTLLHRLQVKKYLNYTLCFPEFSVSRRAG